MNPAHVVFLQSPATMDLNPFELFRDWRFPSLEAVSSGACLNHLIGFLKMPVPGFTTGQLKQSVWE